MDFDHHDFDPRRAARRARKKEFRRRKTEVRLKISVKCLAAGFFSLVAVCCVLAAGVLLI
jgi:hypothetical protein